VHLLSYRIILSEILCVVIVNVGPISNLPVTNVHVHAASFVHAGVFLARRVPRAYQYHFGRKNGGMKTSGARDIIDSYQGQFCHLSRHVIQSAFDSASQLRPNSSGVPEHSSCVTVPTRVMHCSSRRLLVRQCMYRPTRKKASKQVY